MNTKDTTSTTATPENTEESGTSVSPDLDITTLHQEAQDKGSRNYSKVGAARPSALTYTYGPGAIMDLPNFTVMPAGLDEWEHSYTNQTRKVHAPRLLQAVQFLLSPRVKQLRRFPEEPADHGSGDTPIGISARIFPQALRCTKCSFLGKPDNFKYTNVVKSRPDLARFECKECKGRVPAVPAPYLLVCPRGHVDEFPYSEFVHRFQPCPKSKHGGLPRIHLHITALGQTTSASIECKTCGQTRQMSEARGEKGRAELPTCRGRHPHLANFQKCDQETDLILVGASNLWFPATQSTVVMPVEKKLSLPEINQKLKDAVSTDRYLKYKKDPETILDFASDNDQELKSVTIDEVAAAIALDDAPADDADTVDKKPKEWDPITLLEPEWRYLSSADRITRDEDKDSGLVTVRHNIEGVELLESLTAVVAVEKLRKATAVIGFTRLDAPDRIADLGKNLVPLVRKGAPTWVPTAEDRGEGMFLQFDENTIAAWEHRVARSELWSYHRAAHARNYNNRTSKTSRIDNPDDRLPPPRYWLLHTLSHVLLRELAFESGYGAASISERIYAWQATEEREPAAGILLHTTASDSDGTLGGLVQLSEPRSLQRTIRKALSRATRCSSDPICSMRRPEDPEDFLHGAACHCCCMVSETSCENANRFLDRKLLLSNLSEETGFFTAAW